MDYPSMSTDYMSVSMDYLLNFNLNNICLSTKAIWFLLAVGMLAGLFLFRFVSYIWSLRFWLRLRLRLRLRSSSPSSIKRRKRAERKKKLLAVNNAKPDGSVADISQPLLDKTNVSRVVSLRQFPFQSIVDATENFILERRMGCDCLGEFFRGNMVDTNEVFAIRKNWVYVTHSFEEFVAEMLLLSQANHPNLAKLIGYSLERWKRFLVYEYVHGGTLEEYLYGPENCLDWSTRMKIALGVARALEYLQNTMKPSILHLYIEPSNVWLNEEYSPKLSAFGVVRIYSPEKRVNFPSQMIGSYCYAKHDYKRTKNVTIQTDIYGFGIFLLKIITGRNEYIFGDGLPQTLLEWVQPYLEDKQKMVEMVDLKLGGKFEKDELYEVCDIVEMCLKEQPSSRPLIADLVKRMNSLVTHNYDL